MPGTFVRERGGPSREGDEANAEAARYHGDVKDATMTLTVDLPATKQTVGRFALTRGQQGVLRKCY